MLRIDSHHDRLTDELVVRVDDDSVPASGGLRTVVRLAEIRLPVDAAFEDFAADVAKTVVGRELVRGFAGRNPEDPT